MCICFIILLAASIYTTCNSQEGNDAPLGNFKLRCDMKGSQINTKRAFYNQFFCDVEKTKNQNDDPQIGRASLPNAECTNKMGNCLQYKSYCETYSIVKKYCPLTCKVCVPPTTTPPTTKLQLSCKDKRRQCPTAARQGWCTKPGREGSWAKKNCHKSCGVCRSRPEAVVKCGRAPERKNQKGYEKIVSGKNVTLGYYPWQVAIYSSGEFLCGGSLIGKRHILSAAHCFQNLKGTKELKVTLGAHNRDYPLGVEQNVLVKKMVNHLDYQQFGTLNDIAILEIEEDAKLSNYIQIICLPKADEILQDDGKCAVTGWGSQFAGGGSVPQLQEISVPIVDRAQCKGVNDRKNIRVVTENMICAGYYDGYTFKSACHGDSGGPLSCYRDGSWKLFGIVSWGSSTCNALEKFNVFTKVSAYLLWIEQNTK